MSEHDVIQLLKQHLRIRLEKELVNYPDTKERYVKVTAYLEIYDEDFQGSDFRPFSTSEIRIDRG